MHVVEIAVFDPLGAGRLSFVDERIESKLPDHSNEGIPLVPQKLNRA